MSNGLDIIKNRKVYIISTIVLAGVFASIVFHYIQGAYWNKAYPYSTFLFNPGDYFNDFYNTNKIEVNRLYNSSHFLPYFPVGAIAVLITKMIGLNTSFVIMNVSYIFWVYYQNKLFMVDKIDNVFCKWQQLLILTTFTYPFLFAVDRGNLEILLYMFISSFVYLYYVKKSNWCILFLVLSIAMKLYPATLLLLLVADKKYRESIVTIILSILTISAGYYFIGVISSQGFIEIIQSHMNCIAMFQDAKFSQIGMHHNHTLWGLSTLICTFFNSDIDLRWLSNAYAVLALVVFIILSIYVVFIERSDWKKATILLLSMTLLPYTSYDYTMINIYLAIILFANSMDNARFNTIYAVLFALLMIPVDYYYLFADVSISALIYPLTMLIMLSVIIFEGITTALQAAKLAKE